MAKTKIELLAEAKKLKLAVTAKNTIAQISEAIASADNKEAAVVSEEKAKTIQAKSGKRSAKAAAEAEEIEAKEARKAAPETEEKLAKPTVTHKPSRPRIERRGKKFQAVAKHIQADKQYTISEAIELAVKTSPTKFDATVELHVRLGVDPKQADQNIRDNVVLPAGSGKTVRIAVFAEEDVAKEALKAGADIAGLEDLLKQIDKGEINFDTLIATPDVMVKLSKYAKILGPKGLMPNPKSGTVTNNVVKAISQAKAGRVEYRVDSTGIVHLGVGKVSFGKEKLNENVQAVVTSIKQNKPSSLKSVYVRSISLTTSMGPGIKVSPSELN